MAAWDYDAPSMLENKTLLLSLERDFTAAFSEEKSYTRHEIGREMSVIFALVKLPHQYKHLRLQMETNASDTNPITIDSLFSKLVAEENNVTMKSSANRSFNNNPPPSPTTNCKHGRLAEKCWKCNPASTQRMPKLQGKSLQENLAYSWLKVLR